MKIYKITKKAASVGTPTQLLDALPRDTAQARIGSLQQKIFDVLNLKEGVSPVDRDWLVKIYVSYQGTHGKMTRKMAGIVNRIWDKHFKDKQQENETI